MELKNKLWMTGSLDWYAYIDDKESGSAEGRFLILLTRGMPGSTRAAILSKLKTGRSF